MPHGCCCSCWLADRPTGQPASARFESNQLTSTLLIPSEKSKETTKQQHLSVLFCFHTYWKNAAENKRKNSRATLHEEWIAIGWESSGLEWSGAKWSTYQLEYLEVGHMQLLLVGTHSGQSWMGVSYWGIGWNEHIYGD